jgi:hypothetical protein
VFSLSRLSAQWKRVKPPHGFPTINVYGNDVDFAVTSALNSGIQLSVESTESLATLNALAPERWPQHVRAAAALFSSLSSNLSPAETPSERKLVDVLTGTSTVVRISIGKKP